MRRLLVRLLLGKRLYDTTQTAVVQCLDEWAGCVTDPSMHVTPDDIAICAAVRRDMRVVDDFWSPQKYNTFYDQTAWLDNK